MQGHFRLVRVGDSVDGLLDVHAAGRGLIQDAALCHPVAQGGACGRVSHRGQRSVIGAGLGVLLGAPAFAGAVAPFPRGAEGRHAARRRRRFRGRAARGGLWDFFQVGVRARNPLWGVSFAASEAQRPDDLVCCVQRQRSGACFAWGRARPGALPPPAALLLGAAGARCPRAVGTSVRVWGPALSPWLVSPVRDVWCQAPSLPRLLVLGGEQPGFCGPCVPGAVGAGVGAQHRPHSVRPCGPALRAVGVAEGRPRGGAPFAVVRGV